MHIAIYLYIHTQTHTHTYTYTYSHTYIPTHLHIATPIHTYTYANTMHYRTYRETQRDGENLAFTDLPLRAHTMHTFFPDAFNRAISVCLQHSYTYGGVTQAARGDKMIQNN